MQAGAIFLAVVSSGRLNCVSRSHWKIGSEDIDPCLLPRNQAPLCGVNLPQEVGGLGPPTGAVLGFASPLRRAYLRHMFKSFEFCIPTRGTKVPAGPEWVHEIKYDG